MLFGETRSTARKEDRVRGQVGKVAADPFLSSLHSRGPFFSRLWPTSGADGGGWQGQRLRQWAWSPIEKQGIFHAHRLVPRLQTLPEG